MRVRRVRADEADRVRELRLRALSDPVAAIAFLDTLEDAMAQPDAFWQQRTRNAAAGPDVAQFVAIADDAWIGTATVLATGVLGLPRTALVVGVYVAEGHRGTGVIDALLAACATWAADQENEELVLEVHVDNVRAMAAYERCGFVRTGETTALANGYEHVMTRPLNRQSPGHAGNVRT